MVPGIPINFVDSFSDIGIVLNEILRGNSQEERKKIYSLSNPGGLVLVNNLTLIIAEPIDLVTIKKVLF